MRDIKKILFLFCLWVNVAANAQNLNWGYSLGVSFSFGSEVNRLGVHSAAFINSGFAQVNGSAKWYYNFQSLGLKGKSSEIQLGLSGQFGFGAKDTIRNNFIGLSENNTFHDYAAGIAFKQYWDRLGTSQSTGIINANIRNVNLITENDLFGNLFNQKDRFRTGAFLVEYQYNNTKFGITALLWTHDYSNCPVMVSENSKKWARFGYYLDRNMTNRQKSLGLLSLHVKQWLPYNQEVGLNVGVNSEHVRNAFQNEFIHDQPFFPEALVKRKPAHIPMLTVDGQQYLHLDGQKVKPLSFYFNLGLNASPFY